MNFKPYLKRGQRFFESPTGHRVRRTVRYLFMLAVLLWLFRQLTDIGWSDVWNSLPVQPLFYLLFVLAYFQLPFFDMFIYRMLWTFRMLRALPVFLLKRVYNSELLGYSGELYLYSWARKAIGLGDREIVMTIKDLNILSGAASTLFSFGLLGIFLMTGQIRVVEWIIEENEVWFWTGALLAATAGMLLLRFRNSLISMEMGMARKIFSIHLFRHLLLQVFNVLMFVSVIPEAPLWVWFTLISVEIILTRIPFLPSRDLIFVGVSIGLAEGLMLSREEIAGLMLARAALNKLFGFGAFGISAITEPDTIKAVRKSRSE